MTIGHEIWQVRYVAGVPAAVEVLSFAALRRMDRTGRRRGWQRPEFHVLALVESGAGRHRADFADFPLVPGTVVWIRPGVVHRWSDVDAVDGPLILCTPQAVTVEPPAPLTWLAPAASRPLLRAAAAHLAAEQSAQLADPALHAPEVLAALLAALLHRAVRTAPAPAVADGAAHEIFRSFRAAVEAGFTTHHRVDWYARQLGYAPRTLTRATRAAAGVPAKRFLDERILLEAKRLLAHTGLPVTACARRLGFPDPPSFTTFFRHHTGVAPTRWRQAADPAA
ncbi:AraC family transcriptional regulator [Actinoplanes oblitus]|uniref:AraC family transcriptional regulator n=1 Tax=Actinoplanes oblitus TaxID=3040509 RepID=A0ABY8WPE4_9ACTN|nr:AraC family transcriptional regulator [Actinoplanes oblitus]WIM98750.1 AraC family transcriptional regulator [Actinoplanes oblitus]